MMEKVFIVGINGNMGSRYSAILKYCFNIEPDGTDIDLEDDFDFYIIGDPKEADGIILASPTEFHLQDLAEYLNYGVPILCEKPLTTDLEKLEEFAFKHSDKLHLIQMVNQYNFLTEKTDEGETYYNYFKTGNDGIYWDCINLIGLAKKRPKLQNTSPLWECKINGRNLSSLDMDNAYVRMINDWLKNPTSNFEYALDAHRKVVQCSQF